MGAAEQVVDPEVEGRLRRTQLVLLLFADDLEHDLLAAIMNGLRQGFQPVEGEPNVLEADVTEAGVADLAVDLKRVIDGNVIAGKHKNKLGHGLIPSLLLAVCFGASTSPPAGVHLFKDLVRRPHNPPPAERARSRTRSTKASFHRPAKKSRSATGKRSRMRWQFLKAQRTVSGETGGSSSPKRTGAP